MGAINAAWERPKIQYDKAYDLDAKDWGIIQNPLSSRAKIIKTGLTEEEADAWLKLLKED